MFKKIIGYATVPALALALVVGGGVYAEPSPEEEAIDVVEDMVGSFSEVILDGLLVVLPFVAILIGVFFLWRIIRRAVGSSRK
jgi:hypothetical protein